MVPVSHSFTETQRQQRSGSAVACGGQETSDLPRQTGHLHKRTRGVGRVKGQLSFLFLRNPSLALLRYLSILSGPVTAARRNIPDFLFLEVVGRQEVDWRSGETAAHTFTVRMSGGSAEQTARRRPLSRSQLSPSMRGRDLPVHHGPRNICQ